jgi:uncharacterized protein YjiS (DUF1127 family)
MRRARDYLTCGARAWPPGRSGWRLVHAGVCRFIGAIAAERRLRRAIHELESMDDRRLRDLGVIRDDIERVVRFGRDSNADIVLAAGGQDRAAAA